ncbi:MAG: carbohydrate ABC transporter permease [Anaerolineae bacterium]|nr:carbohydrate ABC transporter permease [Thermoflexales bacterium]MDW8406387.1 carbohydrate ABC transporter permease [Anaerolineae bacterium]
MLVAISVLFLIPLLVVVAASFSDEVALTRNGYGLWPSQFSLDAYTYILADPSQILRAYGITISVTLIGTVLGLMVMSLLAYALARQDFTWRRPVAFFVFFTMLFNGGLVPTYILITQQLRLRDTLWVLILPYLVVPWFVFLLRTYFQTLPKEFIESARIDGANEWQIYRSIIMPLSTPALATIGLFCVLMYWNDWWLALLYINEPRLYPLQYLLFAILKNAEFLSTNSSASAMLTSVRVPLQTTRMAMAVVAIGPVAIAFLALQRYFVRGITLGGIKGE